MHGDISKTLTAVSANRVANGPSYVLGRGQNKNETAAENELLCVCARVSAARGKVMIVRKK